MADKVDKDVLRLRLESYVKVEQNAEEREQVVIRYGRTGIAAGSPRPERLRLTRGKLLTLLTDIVAQEIEHDRTLRPRSTGTGVTSEEQETERKVTRPHLAAEGRRN